MSEPTAPSAAQDGGLPEVADICADVDPTVPVYQADDDRPDPSGPLGEPLDAGLGC